MLFLSPHEQRTPKPRHPDIDAWTLGLATLVVLLLVIFAEPALSWLAAHNEAFARSLVRSESFVARALRLTRLAGTVLAGTLALQVGYAFVVHPVVYRLWIARTRGRYEAVVLPRPDHTRRNGATHSNPESSNALWDRLIGIVERASGPLSPGHLAAELWGGPSGRVQWGLFLPDTMAAERTAIRGLITADRESARLVPQPDPLLQALVRHDDDATDHGARYFAGVLLSLTAPDYLPLPHDGLMLPALAAALRVGRDVEAAGISLIISPAPRAWARNVHALVDRWRWVMRYRRSYDARWREEVDSISLKAQQPHARCCMRVHVVARTRSAAEQTCRAIVTTLTARTQRYRRRTQGWAVRRRRVRRVTSGRLPAAWTVRAPMRVLPRVLPLVPLT